MDAFLGTILAVGFNFAPRGWATCSGQLVAISQNSALFALLGTQFGGDGQTTFGLPDLRGRVAIGQGTGPGLTAIQIGQKSGAENVSLTINNLPSHTHAITSTMSVKGGAGTLTTPAAGDFLGAIVDINTDPAKGYVAAASAAPNVALNSSTVASTAALAGNNTPFSVVQPYLGVNYIIALEGIFPSRN